MSNSSTNYIKQLLEVMTFITALLFSFSVAAATDVNDPTGIVGIFCNVINQVTGGIGKVICIIILISMALGLFLGKITWGVAISVMIGMGMLFGATAVVDVIAGTTNGATAATLCENPGT